MTMSTEVDGTSRLLCPSCERVGADGATACAACGTLLVRHVDRSDDLIDGRFEIVAPLGAGGMGRVYRAIQKSIGREVALKMIDRQYERDLSAVRRFLREAKLASQLAHPNTVGVIDFGQIADGRLYLALELVRGRTLEAIVEAGGALPAQRIARIGVQLCDALEAAHALGIIHRDLKLENVMVLDGGRDLVKILDFGLALSLGEATRATATGLFAGTPRYLAPEVIDGAAPAPTQDLYALGVMLGELATGKALWEVTSFAALFGQKLDAKPALDGVEPRLRALVGRLIDPDPAARPVVGEVREVLTSIEEGMWADDGEAAVVAVAAPAVPVVPASMRESQLVSLDGHAHAELAKAATQIAATTPPISPPPSPIVVASASAPTLTPASASTSIDPPIPTAGPAPAFGEPVAVEASATALPTYELETAWKRPEVAAASARSAAAASRSPSRSSRWLGGAMLVAVLVVGGGVAIYEIARHGHHVAPGTIADGHGIEIVITTPRAGTPILIDGRRAGLSPLTFARAAGKQPIVVAAKLDGVPVEATVIPDRDQTIELRPVDR